MGYCQALFHHDGLHEEHTRRMAELLEKAGLPWSRSHELFLGHRGDLGVREFVENASRPLTDLGRVPILITGIDACDIDNVAEIFASPIDVVEGETVLVRLTVENTNSAKEAARLIRSIISEARSEDRMPRWWPLLQASSDKSAWQWLIQDLGDLWKYVNVAINPFTDSQVLELVREQVMVSQIVIPGLDCIEEDGHVRISEEMKIYGARTGDSYNIRDSVRQLSDFRTWPTCIFLGPAHKSWSDEENLERVKIAVQAFMAEAKSIWQSNGLAKYAPLWEMAA